MFYGDKNTRGMKVIRWESARRRNFAADENTKLASKARRFEAPAKNRRAVNRAEMFLKPLKSAEASPNVWSWNLR